MCNYLVVDWLILHTITFLFEVVNHNITISQSPKWSFILPAVQNRSHLPPCWHRKASHPDIREARSIICLTNYSNYVTNTDSPLMDWLAVSCCSRRGRSQSWARELVEAPVFCSFLQWSSPWCCFMSVVLWELCSSRQQSPSQCAGFLGCTVTLNLCIMFVVNWSCFHRSVFKVRLQQFLFYQMPLHYFFTSRSQFFQLECVWWWTDEEHTVLSAGTVDLLRITWFWAVIVFLLLLYFAELQVFSKLPCLDLHWLDSSQPRADRGPCSPANSGVACFELCLPPCMAPVVNTKEDLFHSAVQTALWGSKS